MVSLAIAIVALVLFILPAEYNIDPTGMGKQFGLIVLNNQITAAVEKTSETNDEAISKGDLPMDG